MNLWECQAPGCKNACVGVGGAVGLRAVGWYFALGPVILCPYHYPERSEASGAHYIECPEPECNLCKAMEEAVFWQRTIQRMSQ